MSITRRLFLSHTATAGVVAAGAVPAVAEPEMTDRERAVWHIRELERLVKESGAEFASIMVCGHKYGGKPGHENCKLIGIMSGGTLSDNDGMFTPEGGEA